VQIARFDRALRTAFGGVLDVVQVGEHSGGELEDSDDAGRGTQRIYVGRVRVPTADMCETRFANKVTSLTFDQAEKCAALVKLSEDLLCTSREAPHLIDKVSKIRTHMSGIDASRSIRHTLIPSS
jgi:hypothetical protein